MPWWVKLRNWLFGTEFVLLRNSCRQYLRKAYRLGDYWYSHDFGSSSRTRLVPGGKTFGGDEFAEWLPITPGMRRLYNSERNLNWEKTRCQQAS